LARRAERIRREDQAWQARKDRSEQLRDAASTMALRWVSSARYAEIAFYSAGGTWCGKPAIYYRRAADRQHLALLRLLSAFKQHANTRYPKSA
jgi:hypothetical protein